MNVGLTPTQLLAYEQRLAFRAKIAARAVPQSPPPERSVGITGYQAIQQTKAREFTKRVKPPVKALQPAALPAEPDPPLPSMVWPAIPEGAEEPQWGRLMIIQRIQEIVGTHYWVTRRDIISASRVARLVRPRQVAMYLTKIFTNRSLPDIGRRFGNRDHTTVLHAVRKISQLILIDPILAAEVELLRQQILKQISVPTTTNEIAEVVG